MALSKQAQTNFEKLKEFFRKGEFKEAKVYVDSMTVSSRIELFTSVEFFDFSQSPEFNAFLKHEGIKIKD